MSTEEYIVIGSGPSGVHAALTLIENGKKVTMIDAGLTNERENITAPDKAFPILRSTDNGQHNYFLGKQFEAIPSDEIGVGAQLTPSRQYMIKDIKTLTPVISDNFTPMESLACGGLGVGWGLGCYAFSDNELKKAGLDVEEMNKAYEVIVDRIRVSGPDDDFRQMVLNKITNIHPPVKPDNNIQILTNAYNKRKEKLNRKGIYMGMPSLALLTEDYEHRRKTSYNDMDFYTDHGNSAWRPRQTLEKLKSKQGFKYICNCLVTDIENIDTKVKVNYISLEDNATREIIGKRVLLACGALGSARIVLRSMKTKISRLPLLCNPYYYMPCFNFRMLGTPLSSHKTSMAQAMMIYDTDGTRSEIVSLAFYTYRSLMLFRLLKDIPLGYKDSIKLLSLIQSGFVIAGIHHPDIHTSEKYLELKKSESITGDSLFANYALNNYEINTILKREKVIRKHLKKISCYPIRKISPGYGGSIHYAGTLPFSNNRFEYGTTHPSGELNGMHNVFVADGSGFTYLPAKGISLSLMANAHLTALNSMKDE